MLDAIFISPDRDELLSHVVNLATELVGLGGQLLSLINHRFLSLDGTPGHLDLVLSLVDL